VVPLLVSGGAGSEMRRTLGIAVFSGMLGVTLFGIFLTPVFFYVIQGIGSLRVFQRPGFARFQGGVTLLLNLLLLGIPSLLAYGIRGATRPGPAASAPARPDRTSDKGEDPS